MEKRNFSTSVRTVDSSFDTDELVNCGAMAFSNGNRPGMDKSAEDLVKKACEKDEESDRT